jgi:hypothetical protein
VETREGVRNLLTSIVRFSAIVKLPVEVWRLTAQKLSVLGDYAPKSQNSTIRDRVVPGGRHTQGRRAL